MKYTFSFLLLFIITLITHAQPIKDNHLTRADVLKYTVGLNNTIHIISPEPISYVDISNPNVDGVISEKRLCRVKPSRLNPGEHFTVTVVTPSFLAVYEFTCISGDSPSQTLAITVNPADAIAIKPDGLLNEGDFNKIALHAIGAKRTIYNLQAHAYNLKLAVNNIFIIGDYLMLDIGLKNKSELAFNVEQVKFTIKDQKILKATVSQDLPIEPVYTFHEDDNLQIERSFRNYYFFKKFTFPTDKVLCIEVTEKQVSGRKILLNIDYNQVLKATTID